VKLHPHARTFLGDRALAFPTTPTACLRDDGSALAVTLDGSAGWDTHLVCVDASGVQWSTAAPEGRIGSQPVLVDRSPGRIYLVLDDTAAVLVDKDLGVSRLSVIDATGTKGRQPQACGGGIARQGPNGTWFLLMADPSAFQNIRTVTAFSVDDECVRLIHADVLPANDYPMESIRTSTAQGGIRAPIIGDVSWRHDELFVSAEGSDRMSSLKHGDDFFTLAALDASQRVTRRVYEESGWRKKPGKHGIRTRFTSDGAQAILTPVFASGPWSGRQRLIDLDTGEVDVIERPGGAAEFQVVDVRGDQVLLASNDELLFASVAD
jgi:hypothetical protein